MVYYFTSNVTGDPAFIYVGKDKVENEDLIKYGWDEDVCLSLPSRFHVDNLSSAHVYLRMKPGQRWDDLPEDLLTDCAQLTKANSIEGNKRDNITIIYTPWSNLHKDGSMAVGQVGFHNPKLTRKILVVTRLNPVVNRLNKTKAEKFPDLREEREEERRKKRFADRKVREEKKAAERDERRQREELRWQKDHAYDDLMSEDVVAMSSNQDREEGWEDDFM